MEVNYRNPKIYLLSGKARHGKDTIAGYLKEFYEKDGKKVYTTDVVAEEQYFAESKKSFEERVGSQGSFEKSQAPAKTNVEGFTAIGDDFDDDDIPFWDDNINAM